MKQQLHKDLDKIEKGVKKLKDSKAKDSILKDIKQKKQQTVLK